MHYKNDENNIIDRICIVLNELGYQKDYTVEPSNVEIASDITFFFRKNPFTNSDKEQISKRIKEENLTETIQIKKQKLTIRFSNKTIFEQGQKVECDSSGLDVKLLFQDCSYLIDFCDPNITKALHVGHLRNIIIGSSISSLYKYGGAKVLLQSVACDTGRGMSEALAGYSLYCHEYNNNHKIKKDHIVGYCYAKYVSCNLKIDNPPVIAEGDLPIARELSMQQDLAQEFLDKLFLQDPSTIQLWEKVLSSVISGQLETLSRLGVKFDRTIFESDYITKSGYLVEKGLKNEIFQKDANGMVFYKTGRNEYKVVPLTRTDGFPTEHMRAIALWHDLINENLNITECIHVMGEEWRTSTEVRVEILKKFTDSHFYSTYHKIPYELVRLNGNNMKSSSGEVILIDTLFGWLENHASVKSFQKKCQEQIDVKIMCHLLIVSYFINKPNNEIIDFSTDELVDRGKNPGWIILETLGLIIQNKSSLNNISVTPSYRYLIIQSQFFKKTYFLAASTKNPRTLLKYLYHLSKWYLGIERKEELNRIMLKIQLNVLAAFGILNFDLKVKDTLFNF